MEYEIKESVRAKYLRIQVDSDGCVSVIKPSRISLKQVESFLASRTSWILNTQRVFQERRERDEKKRAKLGIPTPIQLPKPRRGSKAYKEAVQQARTIAKGRLEHFNTQYRFPYGTISIRNQKTRWGSCSATGNLSFNYRIAYLPSNLQDYLIVHELCHVQEHNHSERFWNLVAQTVPNHRLLRNQLRLHNSS